MRSRSWWLLVIAAVGGCGSVSDDVPVVDLSAPGRYATAEFKDDAPANATVEEFPQVFQDADGRAVELSAFRGRKVLLLVLRGIPQTEGGAFCPSCLAQVSGLLTNRSEFERRQVEVLVLFPGPSDRVGQFVETARNRTPGEPAQSFRLLLDPGLSTCTRLGIRADLAKPSTYVLDSDGHVTYAYVGETSTDRPSVKAVLAQLDRVK
jgi:peroxiredoxin